MVGQLHRIDFYVSRNAEMWSHFDIDGLLDRGGASLECSGYVGQRIGQEAPVSVVGSV